MKLPGVLAILLLLLVGYMLNESGFFLKINPHFAGKEDVIDGPAGMEDMTLDRDTRKLYISSTNRRNPSSNGHIFVCDIARDSLTFTNLTSNLDDFKPHGISLLKKYGRTFLFAISHRRDSSHVVERLEFESDTLVSRKTFADPLFISPNDLLAIDTATFYLTNDHGMKPGSERTIKDFMQDKNGYVLLYNQGKSSRVSQFMAYANGINWSADEKYVYVAATTERKIYVYTKNEKNHALQLADSHHTHTGVDNIEVDQFGNLVIGAHPQMLRFLSHASDPGKTSPSQVIKVVYLPDTDYKFLQEELYLNNGKPLSGSSVAVYFEDEHKKNDLFVGSVFESKMLRLHRKFQE